MFDHGRMKGLEFLRRVQRLGRRKGTPVKFEPHQGKGSHGRLCLGGRWTILKNRRKEIGPGLSMCAQLGIDPDEL